MFEERKIKILEKKNRELYEDNKELRIQLDKLKDQIKAMESLVKAADEYRNEHQKMMLDLGECKTQYEVAYKQMISLKNDYESRMGKLLKSLE